MGNKGKAALEEYGFNRILRDSVEYATGVEMARTPKLAPVKANSSYRLDPAMSSEKVSEFASELRSCIIGQDDAVTAIIKAYKLYLAGLCQPKHPICNLLFLGSTGSGKTHTIETASRILFRTQDAFVKINCAEFQGSHEIAKLIGSPPGYLGHRETSPALTQEKLH